MRKPIYLHKNAVALITIFKRYDNIEDLWITDYPEYDENTKDVCKEAAKQFIEQLENQWTQRFLTALRDEINLILE